MSTIEKKGQVSRLAACGIIEATGRHLKLEVATEIRSPKIAVNVVIVRKTGGFVDPVEFYIRLFSNSLQKNEQNPVLFGETAVIPEDNSEGRITPGVEYETETSSS